VTAYPIGARVRIVGGPQGMVMEVLSHLAPPSYRVFLSALATPLVSERDLEPVDAVESNLSALLRRGVYASAPAFRYALTQRKLADQLTDTLFSYNAARIQIQAHQFKPLLKLLDSPYRRLLIADEVGLGKTIEAAIILNEFELRERLERVMVVCPHALLHKWRDELDAKFGMRFEHWTASQVRTWLEDARKNGDARPMRCIVSLEAMRGAETVELLSAAPVLIDLLIVDEAHHLRNDDTYSYALGEALTAAADIALFLSATPLNLRNRDLFNLVHLLLPDVYANEETFVAQIAPNQALNQAIRMLRGGASNAEIRTVTLQVHQSQMANVFARSERFQAMLDRLSQLEPLDREERVRFQRLCMDLNTLDGVLTRTRKADVAPFAVRDPHSIHLRFTAAERAFYDAVTAFCVERYSATGGTGFGATTYQRQVCSCIPAMRELLHAVAADGSWEAAEDEGSWDDEGSERHFPTSDEQQLLDDAITAAHAVGEVDTKYRCFEELMDELLDRQGVHRIMVFSFFRRTIRYLERRLGDRYRVGVIMGGMPLEDRSEIVEKFRKGELQVLLASEVGGEGLDFQFCNVLVNYDLPWNPMRVEQRIGRLDRYGQEHEKILIYNLLVEDTVEARIFGRLFERIELFKAALGDLEAILGDTVSALTRTAMDLRLSQDQQAAKAEQLAQQLIHRKQLEEQLAQGKDALLSNEQYHLDRFGAVQRGRAYLTGDELANFCAEALERHFPQSRITRSGSRWWLRPDAKFAEYVRRVVYGAGADGQLHHVSHVLRPLVRLRSAADAEQAISVTFEADEGFDNRQLELLSRAPQSGGAAQLPFGRSSTATVSGRAARGAACTRPVQDPVDRAAAAAAPRSGNCPAVLRRAGAHGAGVARPVLRGDDRERRAQGAGRWIYARSSAGRGGPAARRRVQRERGEIESRQNDLVQLRLASLQYAFERKRERLQHAIDKVANQAIKRLRRGELANATARHEVQIVALREQNKVAVTYDRIAVALLDVGERVGSGTPSSAIIREELST
jgi:superfamily II DNA or RNA helicase